MVLSWERAGFDCGWQSSLSQGILFYKVAIKFYILGLT